MRGLLHEARDDKRIALRAEEGREANHIRIAENIGQNIGDDGAIFQRIAAARRRLGAVGQNPPLAVGRARQIDRQHVQIAMRGDAHAYHGPEKCGIGIEKFRRKSAARQKILSAVQILENQAQ